MSDKGFPTAFNGESQAHLTKILASNTPPNVSPSVIHVQEPHTESTPDFDTKPTATEIARRLSDGKPHTIAILFRDELQVRAKSNSGYLLDNGSERGLVSSNDSVLSNVVGAMSKYRGHLAHLYTISGEKSEQELLKDQDLVFKNTGWHLPNKASWITFDLEKYDASSASALIESLNSLPEVRLAAPMANTLPCAPTYLYTPPSDPKFPADWNHNDFYSNTSTWDDINPGQENPQNTGCKWWWWTRHSIGGAWPMSTGGAITVASIDTGFQTTTGGSDDITWNTGNARHFFNHISDTNVLPTDPVGNANQYHGTMVADFIAGHKSNGFGLCGVAPDCAIVPIKIDASSDIPAALQYSWATGAKIVNLSWQATDSTYGYNPENDPTVKQAFYEVYGHGCLLVYAAGNDGKQMAATTGLYSHALFVGGINAMNEYYDSSNWGPRVDIAAAAENVSNTVPYQVSGGQDVAGRSVQSSSGTSFAAPLVSGAAALVATFYSDPDSIRDILIYSSDIACPQRGGIFAPRDMSSNHNGTEGWPKIRVLNAMAATKVAYNAKFGGNTFVVYRPASDDYEQIKTTNGTYSINDYYPKSIYGLLGVGTIQCWTYKFNGGAYAGSTSVFKNGRFYACEVSGTPHLEDELGHWITSTWHSTANVDPNMSPYNGWVDNEAFTLQ